MPNSFSFCFLVKLLISPSNWMKALPGRVLLVRFFPFITLNISCHSLLDCRISAEKSADSLMGVPLYVTYCLSLCLSNLLLNSLNIFTIVPWTPYRVDCLSPLHLVLLLGFYLVPLFGRCFSVTSFCPVGCFYFCVSDRLVTFPNLGEVAFCRRRPLRPSSALPSGHYSYIV